MKRFVEFAKFAVLMLVLLFISTWLTGCGMLDSGSTMKLFDTSGHVIAEITDAAVQRDVIYNQSHQKRDAAYKSMYGDSGIQIKFKDVKLADGSMAWLPEELSIREQPRFQQNLETRPPDHRGWDSLDKGMDLFLTGFGIRTAADFGKRAMDNTQPQYQGPYNYNSYNSTVLPGE